MLDKKMKECFKPHALLHTLLGIGLGVILVGLFPALNMVMYGLIIAVVALVLDYMRK